MIRRFESEGWRRRWLAVPLLIFFLILGKHLISRWQASGISFLEARQDSSSIELEQNIDIKPVEFNIYDQNINHDADISNVSQGASNDELSYHPDIHIRGKWQQKQIEKFCEEHGFGNLTYSLDINEPLKTRFYRHMIMDDETKNMYCFLPKVRFLNSDYPETMTIS